MSDKWINKQNSVNAMFYLLLISADDLGCVVDASSFLDKVCSGRTECHYLAVGPDLGATTPCALLQTYLEVEYRCIAGKLKCKCVLNYLIFLY